MLRLAARLLARIAAVTLVAVVASALLLHALPGDATLTETGGLSATAAQRAARRAALGLDLPVHVQIGHQLMRVARGELGESSVERRPVREVIADALPATLLLSGTALALAAVVGISLGTWQGWHGRSRTLGALATLLTALYALPEIIVGIALLALFAIAFKVLPAGGLSDPIIEITGSTAAKLVDRLRHLVLPATTLALGWTAAVLRQQRASVRELVRQPFVRTARAKGVAQRALLQRHLLRPALPDSIALLGSMLPALVGGTVIVESLFAWPGMGSLIVRAIGLRDAPLVAGASVVIAVVVAIGAALTELAVHAVDPRRRAHAARRDEIRA